MRQSGCPDHQGKGDNKNIYCALGPAGGIGGKAEVLLNSIQFIQKMSSFRGAEELHSICAETAPVTKLRNRISGQHNRDKDGRDHICNNQNAILGDLCIGDAFHAAEDRVEENNTHAYYDACVNRHLQKT